MVLTNRLLVLLIILSFFIHVFMVHRDFDQIYVIIFISWQMEVSSGFECVSEILWNSIEFKI